MITPQSLFGDLSIDITQWITTELPPAIDTIVCPHFLRRGGGCSGKEGGDLFQVGLINKNVFLCHNYEFKLGNFN